MKKTINFLLDHEHTERFFVFLILMELLLCILNNGTSSFAALNTFFHYFEIFVISVFAVEYALRVFTMDKFKNIFKPLMMVDLLTILPVTGLIFILSLTFSSVFIGFAEQSWAHLALKKMPPSSLWSIVAFAIFSCDGRLPLAPLCKFITSITPEFGIFIQGFAVLIIGALLFETAIKKYNSFYLKKITIRQESSLIDF